MFRLAGARAALEGAARAGVLLGVAGSDVLAGAGEPGELEPALLPTLLAPFSSNAALLRHRLVAWALHYPYLVKKLGFLVSRCSETQDSDSLDDGE